MGKTKFLECLFTLLYVSSDSIVNDKSVFLQGFPFKKSVVNHSLVDFSQYVKLYDYYNPKQQIDIVYFKIGNVNNGT
ncbi:hypothetical protein [Lonepinella sp. BR2904]|uniref:hypothetical protein n=1 Tax=Lonepinella sp. BR2904 TaxID=3434551 RepID=UPI003F6E1ACA